MKEKTLAMTLVGMLVIASVGLMTTLYYGETPNPFKNVKGVVVVVVKNK